MRRSVIIAVTALVGLAPRAAAQSVFASGGLGVPVAPVDARARALGGIGVGLLGANPVLVNPAEAAGFVARGITAAFQTTSRSAEFEGEEDDIASTRFPLLRILYPVGSRTVVTVGYGGFLDQSFSAFADRTERIGDREVPVRDFIDSTGGISQIQAGLAYSLTRSFAVGLAGGAYAGRLDRVVLREFRDTALSGVANFRESFGWGERAPFATAGVRWDVPSVGRVGASVTWAGTLHANADEGGRARDFEFDLPWQAAAGLSAVLAPRLRAALSTRWAGWSSAAEGFDPDVAPEDTWEFGAGLEWDGPLIGTRNLPVRLGYHRGEYPFKVRGGTPEEWAVSLGLGAQLAAAGDVPLAVVDAALERGARDADGSGLTEDFWRFTFSLAVFGR